MASATARDDANRLGTQSSSPCEDIADVRHALDRINGELQPLGLVLHAQCDGNSYANWIVTVKVSNGLLANKIVRGPLADGGELDMGTPPGLALPSARDDGDAFSPDVQYNRRWLRTLMERYAFAPLSDAWWHYKSPGVPQEYTEAGLAVLHPSASSLFIGHD